MSPLTYFTLKLHTFLILRHGRQCHLLNADPLDQAFLKNGICFYRFTDVEKVKSETILDIQSLLGQKSVNA